MSKPTAPQTRFLTAIVDGHTAPQNVVGDWRPISTCKANGWVIAVPAEGGRVTWEITPEGRSAIGLDTTVEVEAQTPEEIRTAAALAVAEVRAAIPVPTPEEFRARLRAMSGTQSMPATPVPAPLYCLATDAQFRTHIMRAGCTLCGEPARLRRPIANGDVSRVDCLACLDRYTEERG